MTKVKRTDGSQLLTMLEQHDRQLVRQILEEIESKWLGVGDFYGADCYSIPVKDFDRIKVKYLKGEDEDSRPIPVKYKTLKEMKASGEK